MSQSDLLSAETALREVSAGNLLLLDVRAPVEFEQGHIPGSLNIPILNDQEREQVGTAYKKQGSQVAIQLGHELVSGETKNQRINLWLAAVRASSVKVAITCFRGGLRSQTAQKWLCEAGRPLPRVGGGYKEMRRLCGQVLEDFGQRQNVFVLTGRTGSAKTVFLRNQKIVPAIDLEGLANHRGSSFGRRGSQPSQALFENRIAVQLINLDPNQPLLLEDESRMIGRSVIPETFFARLRAAPVLKLEIPLEQRARHIFAEYVQEPLASGQSVPAVFAELKEATQRIRKKLGDQRTDQILEKLRESEAQEIRWQNNQSWIEMLLEWYYDPMYHNSFMRRNPNLLVTGTPLEIADRLRTLREK